MRIIHTKNVKLQKRRGAIAVLAAFCLAIVMAFLAFSVDFGFIAVTASELQNAADAGALSAAKRLPDREATIAAALQWAEKNTAGGQQVSLFTEDDIELGIWDQEMVTFTALLEESNEIPNAVRVVCRRDSDHGNPLPLFFAPILGTDYANLSTSSVAQINDGSCGGIMALEKVYLNDRQVGRASHTDSYNSYVGDYNPASAGHNGDICTNGHLTLNGNSFVDGDARWWEEANSPNADATQVTGDFESFENEIEFPEIDPGNAATVNSNLGIPLSENGVQPLNNGVFQLGDPPPIAKKKKGDPVDPGGGSTEPDSVTLAPGTYYFSEMNVGSNSVVRVTGPTYIYVEGTIDLRYGAIINETKKPMNLQIYPMGADTYFYLPFFGELHAVIYSTQAHIYLDEKEEPVNLEFFGKMVGQKIRVWDTALHVDESVTIPSLRSGGAQEGTSGGATLVE